MTRLLLALAIAGASAASAADTAAPAKNLAVNGDFSSGWAGWDANANSTASGTISLQSEDGNTFLRLAKPTQVLALKHLAIDPAWTKLHVSCRIRLSGFTPNKTISYGNARLANSFVLPEGKRAYLGIVQLEENSDPAKDDGWVKLATTADIPKGALEFEIACGNFGVAGQTDFDDIVVSAE